MRGEIDRGNQTKKKEGNTETASEMTVLARRGITEREIRVR